MDDGLQLSIKSTIEAALLRAAKLPPDNEEHAIHEIRKCIKSVRALLRLLGPDYRADSEALGALGGKLSKFRDAEALLETFDGIQEEYTGRLQGHGVSAIRDGLLARKKELQKGADAANLVPGAARTLRRISRQIAARPTPDTPIGKVFGKRIRRFEKAYKIARTQPGSETLHEWRKRVKEQFYQLQLLEKTAAVEKRIDRLRDIGAWLGDNHNLAVLRDTIFEQPAAFGSPLDVELFLECAAKQERKLRKKALALGSKIYKGKARRITNSLKPSATSVTSKSL